MNQVGSDFHRQFKLSRVQVTEGKSTVNVWRNHQTHGKLILVWVSTRFKSGRLELLGVDCKFNRKNVNMHEKYIIQIYTFGSANACKVRCLNQHWSINSWLPGVKNGWADLNSVSCFRNDSDALILHMNMIQLIWSIASELGLGWNKMKRHLSKILMF